VHIAAPTQRRTRDDVDQRIIGALAAAVVHAQRGVSRRPAPHPGSLPISTKLEAAACALIAVILLFDAARSTRAAFTYTSIGVNTPSFVTAVLELWTGGALAFGAGTLLREADLPSQELLVGWAAIIGVVFAGIVVIRRRLHLKTPAFLRRRLEPRLTLLAALVVTLVLGASTYF
jgi:hypothetical protein